MEKSDSCLEGLGGARIGRDASPGKLGNTTAQDPLKLGTDAFEEENILRDKAV